MKTLIRTKDIARIRHNAGTTVDRLRIDFTDGKSSEWAVDHYEESMSQRSKCKQLKKHTRKSQKPARKKRHLWNLKLTNDMEEKTITIKMKGPRPERRVLKKWGFWVFIACALLVAVSEAIDGNWLCVIWVIVAATCHFFADLFKEYSDDFLELSADLAKELDTMQEVLREKDNKIAELQTENISLRFGKNTKQ